MATKRVASANTAARLAKVLQQVGRDALQPSAATLALTWALCVMQASRVTVLAILKGLAHGTAGFDYGPVNLTLCKWIAVNRLAKLSDPAAALSAILNGETLTVGAPDVPPSVPKATPSVAAPLPSPSGIAPQGVTGGSVAPATPSVQPAAQPVPVIDLPEAGAPVQVDVPPDVAATPSSPYVSPAEKANPDWDWQPASKVFGVKGLRGKVAVWPQADEPGCRDRVLPIDEDYEWPHDHLQWSVFAAGEWPAKGLWYWGNRGAGKTEFARQFAARTGRPFYGVTFTKTMEPMDFIGSDGAKAGDSVWRDGTVLLGLKETLPAVIMFDEMSYGQSSHIAGPLNEIVHPSCTFNVPSTGKMLRFCKGHLFVAADNTNGTGDPTGMYEGANNVNRATMDRFSFYRRFTYLPKAAEIRMYVKKALCSKEIAERVYGIIDALRKKVDTGLLTDPPSNREALSLCCALRSGLFTEADAFETCFVGKYPEESQEEMRVTFTACFNAAP